MDNELAEFLSITCAKAFGELSAILPTLEDHLPTKEYEYWEKTIEAICEKIDQDISQKIYSDHPEVREKAEARLQKYGILF